MWGGCINLSVHPCIVGALVDVDLDYNIVL